MHKGLMIILFCFVWLSCHNQTGQIKNFEAYSAWISAPSHGLVKKQAFSGIEMQMQYLPEDYLIYKEYISKKGLSKDSIAQNYINTRQFLLTIQMEKPSNHIIYKGVSSMEEYKTRIMTLNFALNDLFVMKVGETTYAPILTHFENTYGLSHKLSMIVVFPKEKNEGTEAIDVSFQDDILESGINHFIFESADLQAIPAYVGVGAHK